MPLTSMQLARRAISNYRHHLDASRETTNHNRRSWIKSVTFLGSEWKLHPEKLSERLAVPLSIPLHNAFLRNC